MLKAPRQLLHNGVRAVDTITASGILSIYRILCDRRTLGRTPVRPGQSAEPEPKEHWEFDVPALAGGLLRIL